MGKTEPRSPSGGQTRVCFLNHHAALHALLSSSYSKGQILKIPSLTIKVRQHSQEELNEYLLFPKH